VLSEHWQEGFAGNSARPRVEAICPSTRDTHLEVTMTTNMLIAALFPAVALLSANAALACGANHGVAHRYSVIHTYQNQSPRPVKAAAKHEGESPAPAPAKVSAAPAKVSADTAPVAPSLAAGLADSSF
jgi:hypothetical protein